MEVARFFEIVRPHLSERQRRVVASACSQMLGHGGKSTVAQASSMSRNTVIKAVPSGRSSTATRARSRPYDLFREVREPVRFNLNSLRPHNRSANERKLRLSVRAKWVKVSGAPFDSSTGLYRLYPPALERTVNCQ